MNRSLWIEEMPRLTNHPLLSPLRLNKSQTRKPLETVNDLGGAINLVKHPIRLIASGRSTMGKTTLAVDVMLTRIMPSVRRCYAVCPTFYDQPQLQRLRSVKNAFPKSNVFTTVNDAVFEYIYQQLKKDPKPTLLFVDDAAAEQATNKGNKGSFSRLCLASPHLNLSIVGCFQRLSSASPALRDNAEGLLSFQPTKLLDVETIVKEFNPCPTAKNSKENVKMALKHAWDRRMYAFIYRVPRGPVHMYAAFDDQINISQG